jgi:hypothetical protein
VYILLFRKDWKRHKRGCRESSSQKANVAGKLGVAFSEYADRWRHQHSIAITSIAHSLVTPARAHNQALVLLCDYDTNCGRNSRALIQVNSAKNYTLQELGEQYGAGLLTGMASNVSNANNIDPECSYYQVLCIITNKDSSDPTPLCKVSYLGHPTDKQSILPVNVWVAQLNIGSYDY